MNRNFLTAFCIVALVGLSCPIVAKMACPVDEYFNQELQLVTTTTTEVTTTTTEVTTTTTLSILSEVSTISVEGEVTTIEETETEYEETETEYEEPTEILDGE